MKKRNSMGNIGDHLILLRIERTVNKNEIAAILGTTVRAYTKLEKGTEEINLSQLCKLSDFYGIRKSEMAGGENLTLLDTNEKIAKLKRDLKRMEDELEIIRKK